MKKTLIVCGHYPFPEDIGTSIRTMNFVKFFSEMGYVDIAYSSTIGNNLSRNNVFSSEFFLKNQDDTRFNDRLVKWLSVLSKPVQIKRYTKQSEEYLLDAIRNNNYSYVLVRYVVNTYGMSRLSNINKKKVIIDYDDILSGSLYDSRIQATKSRFGKSKLKVNRIFLRMYEKKCLNYGASIFCSKQDMKNILGLKCNRNNAFVVANIYNNAAFAQHNFRDGYYNKNKLLFVGLLDYYPNVQGLAWFLDNIFNNFKKCFPDAKLDIVGRFPGIDVRNLIQKHIGAELHPDVDDLRPYYDNCRAVIVPLLIGGGTRIKILEAALANRPVLSTSFGANGLEFQDGKNILLFNDYNSFTEKYSKCLEIENYQRIVENAKKLVLDKYSKKQFNDQMQTVIKFVDNNVV